MSRSLAELREYAEDIRQIIISACLANGGHLGASLGAVEIAIALHTVFDSPKDSLIWDVGHQAYAHKIITGRASRFQTLRKFGGISGFLSRDESEHDIFGAGHSSTSLSAALAIAWANGEKKKTDWVVAVIGDGGLTAGLAFEALNNVRAKPIGPMLVVLNDNQMSISPNVGAVPTILSGESAKNFFELFGFDYLGPIDGHDMAALTSALAEIRSRGVDRPIVLHTLTQKGKGYEPAEENPGAYHGIGPVQGKKKKSFSEAFGQAMTHLAASDPRVVALTAAMPEGTGLTEFSRKYPERFFDVGIAEPHATTFAAGLATQGYRPVVAIYSTFLQRAIDSLIHDVALQNLPVTFAIDRAGLVGADGPTHHGMFDLAYLGMIPRMKIFAPELLGDVDYCLRRALESDGPTAVRYPRGSAEESSSIPIEDGVRWRQKLKNPDVIVVSVGAASEKASKALLENTAWVSVISVKPLPQALIGYLDAHKEVPVLCVEDGVIHGGFGQQLACEIANPIELMGYADHFVTHGSVPELEGAEHLSSKDIQEKLRALVQSHRK